MFNLALIIAIVSQRLEASDFFGVRTRRAILIGLNR